VVGVNPERARGERVRLFIALDLPEEVRAGIVDWGGEALRDPALRPVAERSLHLTLAFLGHRPAAEIEPLTAVLGESILPAPQVELCDPVLRPARKPRLLALPALSAGVEELQGSLQSRLAEADLSEAPKRPFWPHVTVARLRSEGRGSRRPMRVVHAPEALSTNLREPFFTVRLALYRSELQPRGARYVPLAQVELPQ
jgi:RNA 2',3'-cyclic 3'-phosphodiesterase